MTIRTGTGTHARMEDSVLSQLSDDSLLEYIADLSQSQSQLDAADYTREQYFREKSARQQQQDRALQEENKQNGVPQIFGGCAVYINGYTKPGRLQLHETLVRHGGKFIHYLSSKRKATHIVATNMPLKKRKEFANYKVVTPEWIVESVKAGKLLPWQSFAHAWDDKQPKIAVTNCNDPNFLNNFFQNSRLHHLSNWKSNLRQNVLQLNDSFRVPKKKDSLTVFHIDFDCFFASVAALDFPNLDIDSDPIVVCHGTHNSDISSCNYAARKYGIKNGMWVSDAKGFLPQGVTLNCLPYNFEKIEAKSAEFYSILRKNDFIKFDEILPISIDESICVKISQSSETPNLRDICQNLRNEIYKSTNCTVSIGCSDTLIMSRLNLKRAKPKSSFILFHKDVDDTFLSNVKLSDIPGVGSSTISKINALNNQEPILENVLQLKKVINANKSFIGSMTATVGNKLTKKILLSLDGKDDDESLKMIYEPINFFERKSLSIDINWGIRFNSIHEVDAFIDICTKYLVEKLNELKKKTSQINLKLLKRAPNAPIEPEKYLGCGKCDSMNRNSKLGIPSNEFGFLTTEIKHNYRCVSCPPNELRGISIQFIKLVDVPSTKDDISKRFINFETFQNLPNDVKPGFVNELKKRKIQIKEPKVNKYQESFLNEIPTQLRNEIKKDLIINEKIKNSEIDRIYAKQVQRQNSLMNSKNHLLGNSNESIFESIKFQNETSFKKICSKIIAWVDFTVKDNGPHPKDLELFENYLDKLSDSNRVPLILRISKLISNELNLKSLKYSNENGFQIWEQQLIKTIIPKLMKNKHTFQTVRKLDLEFDL